MSGFSVAWRRHRHAGIAVSERCHGGYLPARMSFARSLKTQMSFYAACSPPRRTRGEDKENGAHRVSIEYHCVRESMVLRGAAFREAPTRVGEMNAYDMNATRTIQKQDKYKSISKDRTQSWQLLAKQVARFAGTPPERLQFAAPKQNLRLEGLETCHKWPALRSKESMSVSSCPTATSDLILHVNSWLPERRGRRWQCPEQRHKNGQERA